MSAEFWAGYLSGATAFLMGNPLDLLKVRLQAGTADGAGSISASLPSLRDPSSYIKGVAAPILGCGALNALLYFSYSSFLLFLEPAVTDTVNPVLPNLLKVWSAGAVGGLAIWLVSAPTELIKCRAQLSPTDQSSWQITQQLWQWRGLRGLYYGGGITSVRDAVGYGFYFWSYELSKQWMMPNVKAGNQEAASVLLCGGIAGVVTWASIYPLDVIKTRVQTRLEYAVLVEQGPLLSRRDSVTLAEHGAFQVAKDAFREEGFRVFFRGLGVCSLRAFVVNAVQWTVYEWTLRAIKKQQ